MCNGNILKNDTECFYSDYVELIGDIVAENIPVFILNYGVRLLRCLCDLGYSTIKLNLITNVWEDIMYNMNPTTYVYVHIKLFVFSNLLYIIYIYS